MTIAARFAAALSACALAAPLHADEISLGNGDRLSGRIVTKDAGHLVLQTDYAGDLRLAWQAVRAVVSSAPLTIVLADGTTVTGMALPAAAGSLRIRSGEILETAPIPLHEVAHINPPREIRGGIWLSGRANLGLASNRGNSNSENLHVDAEAVARSRDNRYTLGAIADRARDGGVTTKSNATGYMKYDHFFDGPWYGYANGIVSRDRFKDLALRTALGVGAGHQFVESADENLAVEAGLNYVASDYYSSADERYPAARWSLKYDRYMLGRRLQFFHFHELYAGLDGRNRLFLRTQTGLRLPVAAGLTANFQVNADHDRGAAPGRARSDRSYIASLGYHW